MSLRHALLGLLADRPQTGYDLTKSFVSLSRYAWHAGHSHIYPELRKMAADELVEVVGEGARGSRTYGITDRGRAELREWMFTPKNPIVRSEYLLRMFFLSALETDEIRTFIQDVTERAEAGVAELGRAIERLDGLVEPGKRPPDARFAAEFGLRWQQLQLDWARWVVQELDKYEASTES